MRMLLFDFSTERTIDAWVPINDVVMGGVSSGRLEATGNDTAAFTGFVSLENDGGFGLPVDLDASFDHLVDTAVDTLLRK